MSLALFEAPSQSEAMAKMAAALGPDALIVSCREYEGGFQLTAASAEEITPPDLETLLDPPIEPECDEELSWVIDYHRPSRHAAECLTQASLDEARSGDKQSALPRRLEARIPFQKLAWPVPERHRQPGDVDTQPAPRRFALIGAPGSGKTALCARMALTARLAGGKPHVFSLDTGRTAGQAQLKGLLGAMGLSLQTSSDTDEPCLIDTGGINPFSTKDLVELARVLEAEQATPILVMDASCDAEDASDIAHAFMTIGVKHTIVTRLDLCRRLGSVISIGCRGLALAGATVSPMIAKQVLPLTASGLSRLLLAKRDKSERRP